MFRFRQNERRRIVEMVRIVTFQKGEITGDAYLTPFNNDFNLAYLEVPENIRKKGHGSRLIQAVNLFLLKQKTSGILLDETPEGSKFYERNGWIYNPKEPEIKYYKIR